MLTGVILAGDRTGRMERMKDLMENGGGKQLARQAADMATMCDEVIVVANDPKPLLQVFDRSVRLISDFYRNAGPLGGMHAAFTLAKHPYVWTVACNMPGISMGAAETLLASLLAHDWEAAIPEIGGGWFPLHAVYRQDTAGKLQQLLDGGQYAMADLLQKLHWGGLPEREFRSRGIDLRFVEKRPSPPDVDARPSVLVPLVRQPGKKRALEP